MDCDHSAYTTDVNTGGSENPDFGRIFLSTVRHRCSACGEVIAQHGVVEGAR